MASRTLLTEPELRRFYAKVTVDLDTGCWLWDGGKTKRGYGVFKVSGIGTREVHSVSYNHFVDAVPDGLVLGHTCKNKCAFWEHVRPITQAQNVQEAYDEIKGDTCNHGHPRTSENTRIDPKTGWKSCKVCIRITSLRGNGCNPCTTCGYVRCRCS